MTAAASSNDPPPSPEELGSAEYYALRVHDEINWLFLFFCCLVMIGFMQAPGLHELKDSSAAFPTFMHWILESLTVSVAVVIVAGCFWREVPQCGQRFLLASGLFAAGGLDFFHELVYRENLQQAILFWLAARCVEGLSLFAVVATDWGVSLRRRTGLAFLGLSAMINLGVCYLVFFQPQIWPSMFEPEKNGLTNAKIYTEYLIIAGFVATLLVSILRNDKLYFLNLAKFQTGLFFSILCSLWFTIYPNPGSIYSFCGHIYKVLAYYFFLKAFYTPVMPRWFLLLVGTLAGVRFKMFPQP